MVRHEPLHDYRRRLHARRAGPGGQPGMSVQSESEAVALLVHAVRFLQPRQESVQLIVAWRGGQYRARFDWPGVVHLVPVGAELPAVSSVAGDPSRVASWREIL